MNIMSNCLKIIFLSILVCFFNFTTTEAQLADEVTYVSQSCSENKTTANSTYKVNLRLLLSSLSSETTASSLFYNNTVLGSNSSDTVYGMFMCRGDIDVSTPLCRKCVVTATEKLSSDPNCSQSIWGLIFYEECTVRYSNASFFSTVDTFPGWLVRNWNNISSNSARFMSLLSYTMNQTAHIAASSSNRYSTKQALISPSQTIYCLVQCTQDLSPQNCTACLAEAITWQLPMCCDGKIGGKVLLPSCNIMYELYPFYRLPAVDEAPPQGGRGLVPTTRYPHSTDSEYSEDPGYISHNCSSITTDTSFHSDLRSLFSNLSSNNGSRYKIQVGTLQALFPCRGDISNSPRLCEQCIQNATEKIAFECPWATEGVIWYNHCWLRYSNHSLSVVETTPSYVDLNLTDTDPLQYTVAKNLSTRLSVMANETGDIRDKYHTGTLTLNDFQTVYILAQCTLDLSSDDCSACLSDVIESAILWPRLGSVGGTVLYPSCILRFEMFKFYDLTPTTPTTTVTPPSPSGKGQLRTIVLIITSGIIVLGILFTICYYFIRRKARKNNKTILRENFGHVSSDIESLQFSLATLEAATNNFSHENKIGKGGFGEVYKGILIDGRSIAVKRLSRNSKQGVEQFKNEVLLIAKLQHKNLVTFIGFYLDEQEKMLIYEYVSNKSLDYFLFDTKLEKILSWSERYKIIRGIARGILYLHEDSRLKIIHRDLKPSNILLDNNLNPKIADFGLARIIDIDQHEGSTSRIVGTQGYMSPEYALFGQFSEKSDVYSFGIMVLEIISGKKNINSYEPHRIVDGLLNFVWRHWKDETPLSTLDAKLNENYSSIEVIKCIQIGLLCVEENPNNRPTMVTIVSYLSSHLIELPSPQEPTFIKP